jgi:hypothetical protein
LVDAFVGGARDLLGVALIIGLARGIVVVMDAGHMTDTILYWAEGAVSGLNEIVFINVMYWIQVVLSFLRPVDLRPRRTVDADPGARRGFCRRVERSLVVTAFQSAEGVVNLITPTSAVVMGGLAIARVPYERWLRFVWPVLVMLTNHCHGRPQCRRPAGRYIGMTLTYGVHSEAGKLRRVLVHKPGAAMARLTPCQLRRTSV